MRDLDEVKARLPLPALLHQLGVGELAKKSAPCEFHDDQKNSFSVSQNKRGQWFWKCFAGCGTGDEITFLEKHFGISKGDAIKRFKEMAGVSGTASGVRPALALSLDWPACVEAFVETHQERLADWRGLSGEFVSWLKQNAIVGLFENCIAFAVHDVTGSVVAAHYRLKNGSWRYYPVGAKMRPLVIGKLEGKGPFHTFESTWDGLAFLDKSGERSGVIITRGAANGRLVAGLLPPGAILYAWTQNDQSGERWLSDVCVNRKGTVKGVTVPKQFKDLNAWTLGGATPSDLLAAITNSQIVGIGEAMERANGESVVIAELEPDEEDEEPEEERPPDFPIESLPPILRRVAEEISKIVGVPLAMSAPMTLATGAIAIGKGLRVRGPRYVTTANLYVLVCKTSGSGGSQTFGHATKPLIGMQQTLRHDFEEQEEPRIKTELKDVELQIKNLETDLKKAKDFDEREKIKSKLIKLNAKHTKLEKCRSEVLYVTDTTPEAFVELLSHDREESMGQVDSDAAGALAIIKGERYTSKGDINAGLSVWLKAYSRESISLGRKSGGGKPQHVEEPCVSLLFVATPGDVQAFFRDTRLTNSGLLPRFLACDPKARPVLQDVNDGDASPTHKLPSDVYEPYKAAIYAVINRYRLFKRRMSDDDDDAPKTEIEPFEIEMTTDARKLVKEDWNRFCSSCDDEQDHPYESRHTENGIRIALNLHVFRYIRRVEKSDGTVQSEAYAHEHPLDEATMRDAFRIRDFFNWHQEKFRIPQQAAVVEAGWGKLKTMLHERPIKGITLRDLYRNRKICGSKQEAEQFLGQLKREGLIESFLRETTRRGGRPVIAYRLARV
jgi:uncharacterized protein DUF3987/CHC2-type zinc finger protein